MAELATGSTFAHYRTEGLVGRGGMGVVYRATDLQLQRPVALKLIAPELAGDEGFRSRFLRESRVAASLDHPNVIPIYEAGDEKGQLYIAMRYVEGEDLKTLLQREGTLAPERTIAILGKVADALDAAHERGLVHRDVKPGNVLLDGREHAYLTDFGLTKQLGGASTETGRLLGTLDYLAPEQIRGEAVDASTDCYTLACVLYECLAGAAPFRRQTEAETLWAHMQEEAPAIPAHPALGPVWRRALAKAKDDRYGSCRELIDAVRGALRPGAAVSGERVRDRRSPRRLRMGRRLALIGVVLVGGTSAAVIVSALREEDSANDATGEALPGPACREVVSSSLRPDVLIVSDLTLRGEEVRGENQPLADAIRFVLRRHGFKAGPYTVGYQSCDNSSARQDLEAFLKQCGSNASMYARATRLVAVIGNLYSGCAATQIPILNRARGGPVVMISPGNTKPGLTRGGLGAEPGEPEMYYPTGERNFFRVVPPDHLQGSAQAILAKRLRLRSLYVLDDGGPYGVLLTTAFRRAAQSLDLKIAGSGTWDPGAKRHAALAERVAESGADGVFLGGTLLEGGAGVIQALRAQLGARVTIMGGDGFHPVPDLLEAAGPGARGMYISVAGVPLDELAPDGLEFVSAFAEARVGKATGAYTVEAAQAAEVVLQAIARSDGTRASVLKEMRATEVEDGMLGDFRLDGNGDINPAPVTIYEVTGEKSGDVFSQFRGAVVDQVIRVPDRVSP